jgi:ligand-binding sensor protein
MNYLLVKPDGSIAHSWNYPDDNPPAPHPNKGRWLLNNPPQYDVTYYDQLMVTPIPPTATTIPYVLVERSLTPVKNYKLKMLAEWRDLVINSDITIGGKTFSGDRDYQSLITRMLNRTLRGKSLPSIVRGKSGPTINNPQVSHVQAIEDAFATRTETTWNTYWSYVDGVTSATTIAEIKAIASTEEAMVISANNIHLIPDPVNVVTLP